MDFVNVACRLVLLKYFTLDKSRSYSSDQFAFGGQVLRVRVSRQIFICGAVDICFYKMRTSKIQQYIIVNVTCDRCMWTSENLNNAAATNTSLKNMAGDP